MAYENPALGIFEGEIAKVDDDERLVFGWAYISHDEEGLPIVDKEGDFVADPEELAKAAYDFTVQARAADVYHDGVKVAECVESVCFTPEKIHKMGLDEAGIPQGAWWVGFRVLDDATWSDVKKGRLGAFSIGGKGTRRPVR